MFENRVMAGSGEYVRAVRANIGGTIIGGAFTLYDASGNTRTLGSKETFIPMDISYGQCAVSGSTEFFFDYDGNSSGSAFERFHGAYARSGAGSSKLCPAYRIPSRINGLPGKPPRFGTANAITSAAIVHGYIRSC